MQSRILTKHNHTIGAHGAENRDRKPLIRSGYISTRTCCAWEHSHGYGPHGIPAANADDFVPRHRGKNDCVMEKELASPPYFKGRPGSEGKMHDTDADRHFGRCAIGTCKTIVFYNAIIFGGTCEV